MDKVTTNSGIPVFGEVIKLLNKQEITKIAEKQAQIATQSVLMPINTS